ncbi:MAG: SDR family oxidoreductase [Desulfuromonadaceae bacterium]|nr:SDR family oxidoreductase [Desulfuromonadaceae bacterium]
MVEATKTVLIAGATGYIGRRLKDRLLRRGDVCLRLLVRRRSKLRQEVVGRVEVVEGDTFQAEALRQAVCGVDTAYYLIHSMGSGADYAERDRRSAENFRNACVEAGVRRIIYLGGLGCRETASAHLLSRLETGEILSSDPAVQTLWFRAGVILGAGSASFEIIYHLVQKLPVMLTPRWLTTRTQAIAVVDVVNYLEAALYAPIDGSQQIDIGSESTDFGGILRQAAHVMGLRRWLIPVSVLTPHLSSYWLMLVTPVPFSIASALIEGLKSETLIQNEHARLFFPQIEPVGLEQAFRLALQEIENDEVLSRWCDSSDGSVCDLQSQDDLHHAVLRDVRRFALGGRHPQAVFETVCTIGGQQGWFSFNSLWRLRGVVDKLFGGAGLNRGRRVAHALRVGDALDFWKVVDLKPGKRLLLLSQMKLPGTGWLEFVLEPEALVQTAHFCPKGLWGRVYWALMVPFHALIFRQLGQKLLEQSDLSPKKKDFLNI